MKDRNFCCGRGSVNDILQSIACEEAGIAHILNAEGEKLQKALEMNLSFEELLALGKAVSCVITDVTNLEIALGNKIKALGCLNLPSCSCRSVKPKCTIAVRVCDVANRAPICDAIVKVRSADRTAASGITDEKGMFTACGLENACYKVCVKLGLKEKYGYADLRCCRGDAPHEALFLFGSANSEQEGADC